MSIDKLGYVSQYSDKSVVWVADKSGLVSDVWDISVLYSVQANFWDSGYWELFPLGWRSSGVTEHSPASTAKIKNLWS